MYMRDEELALLAKLKSMVNDRLSEKENDLLAEIIKNYTKRAS